MRRLWRYAWKSSDGSRHEGTIDAETRDGAFAALRERGIRPIKVTQVLRLRDRLALLARSLAFVTALVAFSAAVTTSLVVTRGLGPDGPSDADAPGGQVANPMPRKQLDTAGLDLGLVFRYESERYLARFASPGRVDCGAADDAGLPADIHDALESPIVIRADDSRTVVDLKRIVAGIKRDVSLFASIGKSPEEIGEWLATRQLMEANYRQQLIGGRERDVRSKAAVNEKLRALGLAEID